MARLRHGVVAALVGGALAVAGSAAGGGTSGAAGIGSVCTAAAPRSAVSAFVAAFNAGDAYRLDGLFARRPRFQWYSSPTPGRRLRAAAANRGTLVEYFRARHARRDRLRLASFRFTGNSNGYGHFALVLRRSAADYRHGAWFGLVGKGAAICTGPLSAQRARLAVLSLGGPGSHRRAPSSAYAGERRASRFQ
jgi:hypothetical protein